MGFPGTPAEVATPPTWHPVHAWEVDGDLRQSHKLSLTPDDKDQIWVNFPRLSKSLLLKSLHKLTLLTAVPQPLWALSLEHPKLVLTLGAQEAGLPILKGHATSVAWRQSRKAIWGMMSGPMHQRTRMQKMSLLVYKRTPLSAPCNGQVD